VPGPCGTSLRSDSRSSRRGVKDYAAGAQLCSIPYGRGWLLADISGSGIVAGFVRHRTDASREIDYGCISFITLADLRRPVSVAEVVASPVQGSY
jgi:hypothetical protein